MSEHAALLVDRLVTSTAANSSDTPLPILTRGSFSMKKASSSNSKRSSHQKSSSSVVPGKDDIELYRSNCIFDGNLSKDDAAKPLFADTDTVGECRICQEEDDIVNLESPCACTGSLKFVHRKCVQHWCDEKGDTVCEICRKPYEGGYTAPPLAPTDSFSINIGGSWEGQRLNLQESRLFSVASDDHFLDSDYEEYTRANARSAACFRAVAFMLMVILLLRHVSSMTPTSVAEDDVSTFILLFLLRAVGFFLPCYIMARALNVLHGRRRRGEAILTAAEVSYLLQNGQAHGLPIAAASA